MWLVEIAKPTEKELKRAPMEVRDAFDAWKNLIEQYGPLGIQKINGYWDHALKGEWKGARASSLNRQWRVIYVIEDRAVKILVLKVTPHDYRRK
ncbi:MAG: type II toxin-antitoxin system mRNA interferase toxin, RelE/StbE family [Bdellovibrionales bacterium]|nr:type II toxin-antitoxin system mRNA interferase toxin, RelE/StbE family [Bdellovibrionales bacterium]